MHYETITRAVEAGFVHKKIKRYGDEFAKTILCLEPLPCGKCCQFDCGRVPDWKIDGPMRIFPGWRQLCNAIAALSTDALKRSSWCRIRVMRSARSAELL